MNHRDYMADAVAECERGPMSESDSKRLARLRERIAACSEYCGDALPPAELIWLLDLAERTIKAEAEMDETKMRLEIGLADMESPAGLMKWKSSTRQPSEETRRKISEGRKAFLARKAAETAALAEPVQT